MLARFSSGYEGLSRLFDSLPKLWEYSNNKVSGRSFSHQGHEDLGVEGFGDAAQQGKRVAAIAGLLDCRNRLLATADPCAQAPSELTL